jgi:hypothetical protein
VGGLLLATRLSGWFIKLKEGAATAHGRHIDRVSGNAADNAATRGPMI